MKPFYYLPGISSSLRAECCWVLLWFDIMQKFNYNSKFEGNILVERKTDSGKTTFIQNLAENNFSGKRKKQSEEWSTDSIVFQLST